MHAALYLIWFGVGLSLAGWLWYRHPGQSFWVMAPVWRAAEFLRPVGVWLWRVGTAIGLVGVIWLLGDKLIG
ncbi:hypothetical protein [Shewanella sp. FJAT-52076]|uniref:hypothetical protein n=1 Tax=Shewanella sp. FJAT-52076 TaxID=2864202 RepID=UPI001C65D4F5|nr:hypothetical protein [Shewanella sp. FJAT-52076]QYJ75786.1 hypothetical protein K0H79_01985 [Shewanella sp. FJAT-52076]